MYSDEGCLAYYDSFKGLVPCWITAITGTRGIGSTAQTVTIKFTATRGPFKRGETWITNGLHVCPRGAAKRGKHVTKIMPYEFV